MIYSIKGVGLDTVDIIDRPHREFDYLHIDFRSNNTFLLDKISKDSQLICTTHSIVGLKMMLSGLLSEIGRPKIEVLLIDCSCEIEKYSEYLKYVLDLGIVDCVGLCNPENLGHLKIKVDELKKVIIPSYIGLNVSPIYFQKEIIDWARDNELGIISFNPLGGKLSAENAIRSFSVPYLLSFSASYSDLVFLSSGNLEKTYDNSDYLKNLIGKEYDENLFRVDFSVNSLVSPYNKIIETGIKFDDDTVIPYNNPNLITYPDEQILSLSEVKARFDYENSEIVRKIKENIVDFMSVSISKPEDGNNLDYFSCIRPDIIRNLRGTGWKVAQAKLSDNTILIVIRKELKETRLFWRSKKIVMKYSILLSVLDSGDIVFQELKNTDEENQKP